MWIKDTPWMRGSGSNRHATILANTTRHAMVYTLVLLVCGSCHNEPPAQEPAAEARSAAAESTPHTVAPREALPRTVAGVSLGMSRADAEGQLGQLSCRDTQAGYQVCTGQHEHIDDVTHLELYVHHEHVISLSYDGAIPPNAWDLLDRLAERYGRPSLSGVRKRDQRGRLHEVYGWKDDQSLYSVRFIWQDTDSGARDLVGTAIALWDRKGYQQWEAETQPQPTPATSGPNEPA